MSTGHLRADDAVTLDVAAAVAAQRRRRRRGLVVVVLLLVLAIAISLLLGSRMFALGETVSALWQDNGDAHIIVAEQRLPRAALALLVGLALGAAGALMQGITRNPLADPGLFGVSAGAEFAIVLAAAFLPVAGQLSLVLAAFVGAVVVTLVVYVIGTAGGGGSSPLTLVLAGVATAAVLSGVIALVGIFYPRAGREARGWGSGDLEGGWGAFPYLLPFVVVGLVLAVMASRGLNAESLGDDLATALGANRRTTRILVVVAVTVLCGAATAAIGVVWFVGMMVPHMARWFVGPDQRWILLYASLFGAVLVLVADVVGRLVASPAEIPAGIVSAFIGAPVLIYFVRRPKVSTL